MPSYAYFALQAIEETAMEALTRQVVYLFI